MCKPKNTRSTDEEPVLKVIDAGIFQWIGIGDSVGRSLAAFIRVLVDAKVISKPEPKKALHTVYVFLKFFTFSDPPKDAKFIAKQMKTPSKQYLDFFESEIAYITKRS